jgi:UDP-N-acetylmuramyl pentapeptide phosphotransferase/UDP-N-acetylglucosamine-1-phosphate transferase
MMSPLLAAMGIAFVVSAITSLIALTVFPWFRSGERKEGHFRPDQSTGSFRVDTRRGKVRVRSIRPGSHELPLVGGPAMVLAVLVAGVVAGIMLNLTDDQWTLLVILLAAMVGYAVVGFVDDRRKVYKGEGITEIQKFIGVVTVSLIAAAALNRLITTRYLSARLAYPPYSDVPVLGRILVHTPYAWVIFFLLMTVTVASSTALAVDFSDGMDGLSGGLLLSAALSFAAILLGEGKASLWPAALVVLALAGATAGYLPFNWPSSWKARDQSSGRRRAVLIMGDTGSLALGGVLALVAVICRLEFVLLFVGGVFVLEGVSALVSARILVRFFRRFLVLERYGSSRGFAHTELPLPFLATPMHHHYDLLGWDRKRLVYGAWLLGAGLGVLGVASVIGTFTWERYLARFVALLIIIAVWQSGPWTRSYFIGLVRTPGAPKDAPRQLALFYGFPYRLFGRPLSARVETTALREDTLETPAEKLSLWQRMSVFDACSVLGYYCYRANLLEDAQRIWSRIPSVNLEKRPDIEELAAEVRHTLAITRDGAPPAGADGDADAQVWPGTAFDGDPGATTIAGQPLGPYEVPAGAWRLAGTSGPRLSAARLQPADGSIPPDPAAGDAALWNPAAYAAWTTGNGSLPGVPLRPPTEAMREESGPPLEGRLPNDTRPSPEAIREASGPRNEQPTSLL